MSRLAPVSGAAARQPFRVALTFDAEHPDRPSEPDVHDRIVEGLERAGIRATFFVQGRWAQAYPDRARALARNGHLVGSHSFYHVRMPLLSPAGLANDVRRAERAIHDIVKVDPRPWFRLPFGSGRSERRVIRGLEGLGYRSIWWDVEAGEWRLRATTRDVAEDLVSGAVARGDGAIVLMHSWPRVMPAALDETIARLRDAGATFVTLDELDGAAATGVAASAARGGDRRPAVAGAMPIATYIGAGASRRPFGGSD